MIVYVFRIAALTFAVFATSASAANAQPIDATLAVTVNAISGDHEISGGRFERLHSVPLPLGELMLRYGADSLRVEGMPPLTSTFGTGSASSTGSARISILTATYRRAFGGGWFAGVGQTVYNQSTFDVPNAVPNGYQFSRVTGVRWELGHLARIGRGRIEAWAAVNPVMHGVGNTLYRYPDGFVTRTTVDAETASQLDLSARVAQRLSPHGELLYGLRYLNFSAYYDSVPGRIADRNVGFAPLLGYRLRL
jgi:hypothetical protein